jgi:AcrR family transcriptional regulator
VASKARSKNREVEREPGPKRLPKEQRRDQLIETALRIVRERGTDALTLAHVAEESGVTKPIAYEHFETRAGLLVALAKYIDDRQLVLLHAALKQARPRLEDVARVISCAYLHCYTSAGPEWNAIVAALAGDEAMEAFQRDLLDNYVSIFQGAFGPVTTLPKRELHLRCVAILGAADALGREMLRGRVEEATAARTLGSLAIDCLAPPHGHETPPPGDLAAT